MQLQSVCSAPQLPAQPRPSSSFHSSPTRRNAIVLKSSNTSKAYRSILILPIKRMHSGRPVVSYLPNSDGPGEEKEVAPSPPNLKLMNNGSASNSSVVAWSGRTSLDPYRGKSGSVSFCGLSYQLLEERKLVSSPFNEGTGSFVWVVAPLVLISSLLLPQFFIGNAVEVFLRDEILAEIVVSLSSEVIFYMGLAAFLFITNQVQRPYLDFSSKRWSLITGLRGYLSSAFFTMGFKVFAPVLAIYVFWPTLGLPALVAVFPFVLGCAVQYAFELYSEKHRLSCWPLLPIIFEVYRLYQLNKGAHFMERLLFSMRGLVVDPTVMERSNALVSMVVVLQVLGAVCLWSLATFLLRLFPSRPVAENY